MADNTALPGVGDVVRDIDRSGVKTQVVTLDFGGEAGPESLVTGANPLPIAIASANFVFSTRNSSTVQLAQGAMFSGVIETALNQPEISVLMTSDQPIILTLYQYIDLAGTFIVSPRSQQIPAGYGFSYSIPINGNYVRMTAQNVGSAATTTFNLNVAYGTITSADPAGNSPVNMYGSGDLIGVALLEEVVKGTLNIPVQVQNTETRDANGNIILSDCPTTGRLVASTVGQQFDIDTLGYQSLTITMGTMAATLTGCNDPAGTFAALSAQPVSFAVATGTLAAATTYIIPCYTRYLRLTTSTLGWATYYLRNLPATGMQANVVVGGTTPPSAGIAGSLAVGGASAVAGTSASYPVIAGGVDAAALVRRQLMDPNGRVQVGNNISNPNPTTYLSTPAMMTQDLTLFEGKTAVELLAMILFELRILAQQHADAFNLDDPDKFRNDPTMFQSSQ